MELLTVGNPALCLSDTMGPWVVGRRYTRGRSKDKLEIARGAVYRRAGKRKASLLLVKLANRIEVWCGDMIS